MALSDEEGWVLLAFGDEPDNINRLPETKEECREIFLKSFKQFLNLPVSPRKNQAQAASHPFKHD